MKIKSIISKAMLARTASRTKSAPLSLPLEFSGKSLLVLLPDEQRELTVVKQILPDITAIFGTENVYLLSSLGMQIESIFPSKGFRYISTGRSAIKWTGLPSRPFLDKLRKYRFDYIFDTNLSENVFASRILLEFPRAVRFGNGGYLGTPYLNLEIKTKFLRDRRQIYRSILEVLARLACKIDHPDRNPDNVSRSNGVPEKA
jgi:hypothetical protein